MERIVHRDAPDVSTRQRINELPRILRVLASQNCAQLNVAGIEVKATSTVARHDVKWLAMLRDKLGSRFIRGLVLHTGPTGAPFGDRVEAGPMDVLWS